MAVYVQEQLRQVGIRMEIEFLEWLVVIERLDDGDFEAAFMVVQPSMKSYEKKFGSDPSTGYKNPQVIKLIEQATATMDPNAHDRIHRELLDIFRADVPVTFLMPSSYTVFAHRRIKELSTPGGSFDSR